VDLACKLVAEGHDKLKMQAVAANSGWDVDEDVQRVRMVRDAVGPHVRLMLDANRNFNGVNALRLAKRLEDCDLTFFDDPVHVRDWRIMAELRQRSTVPLAMRPAYEDIWSAREMICNAAVDVVQANVLYGGGYSECVKVAHMAEMFNLPVATGGAFFVPNAHLIAGLSNGWMTEYHLLVAALWDSLLPGFPRPSRGRLTMPDAPGIGWTLDAEALDAFRVA
jgi:L-alanine-DL-glutamate epimerase-like enolase superfamily enzyme